MPWGSDASAETRDEEAPAKRPGRGDHSREEGVSRVPEPGTPGAMGPLE